jgi:hypothetical protein
MPISADTRNWQIWKSAVEKLVELQPENESAFVFLSNIKFSTGMWSDST